MPAGLRVERSSDDVTAIRDVGHGPLPDLACHGRAEVDLAVEVLVRDPGEELVQSRSGAGSDDQSAVDDGDIDLGLLLQTRFRRERLGDSDYQTVSPPLNLGSHDSTKYTLRRREGAGGYSWAKALYQVSGQARL